MRTNFSGSCRDRGTCVFIGTSITALRPANGINLPQTFCAIISIARGFPFYVNAGVPSDTTTLMLARYERDVLSKYPGMIAIEVGPNDEFYGVGTTAFNSNVRTMVQMAKTAGIAVTIINPFLVRDPTHDSGVNAYRTLAATICSDTSSAFFDIYGTLSGLSSGTLDTLYITADNYHFTVAGQAYIAARASDADKAATFRSFL